MPRGGGGRGVGRGGRRGGYARKDARQGGGASREDRDRRERDPDRRPRRSPSPDHRPRRPRGQDEDRDMPRGGRVSYGGGDRSPAPTRSPRRGHTDYGDRHFSPRRGHTEYDEPRELPGRGSRNYDNDHHSSPRGSRGYGGDRHGSPPGARGYGGDRHGSPPGARGYGGDRHGSPRGSRDYGRAPYREEHDRAGRGDNHPSRNSNLPPSYMLPDHPSDLGRLSLHGGRKESGYFGRTSDGSDYLCSDRQNSDNEIELLGDGGGSGTLRIRATKSGRTSSLYPDMRSVSPRAGLSPLPLYPSVPPRETGFLTGASAIKAVDVFGTGNTRSPSDDADFKYRRDLPDPYAERSREIERLYSVSRDLVVDKDEGTNRLYTARDVPTQTGRDTEKLYASRGMLGSDLVPCTQLKQIGDSSLSLLAKDQSYGMHSEPVYEASNGYVMNGVGRPSHDSLGHGSGHAQRFSGSSKERGNGYGDEALLDIPRKAHSKHTQRAELMESCAPEYITRDPINDTYLISEKLHGNVLQSSREVLRSASWRGFKDERINHHVRLSHRIEEDEDSFQAMRHDTENYVQHSYGGDASAQYQTARCGNDRYSNSPGTEPIGIARRAPRQHDFVSFEDLSEQEVSPMASRKRYRNPAPAYRDHEMDVYPSDDDFAGQEQYDDHIDRYDLSPARMTRSYDMVDDDEYNERYGLTSSRNVFSRLALPHETSGEMTDQENHPHLNTLSYRGSKYIPMSQRLSRPDPHSKFGGPSLHGRGRGGLTKNAKKRLKTTHQFNGGYPSEDVPNTSEVKHDDALEYDDLSMQKDPSEDSEEFRKQVHQAFLKYAKILNENPAMQKKYREASKGTLSCCVCGSVARKFPDLDALLSHAYDTCKVGLKTKHFGFHKALCVLMGWNWHVAPDTSKTHHSIPAEEVNAMKEDLMLWPPVVVIHNSSIANKEKDTEAKIVSIEEIEGVMADIGVPHEKAKVSHGRPANQSVFLVKFQPTISGFQEAMRIHNHFSTKNHGREEFQQMRGGKGKNAAPVDNLEELLFAHMAVAEDLGHLDEGTKRRCMVKSKKEIEANADV